MTGVITQKIKNANFLNLKTQFIFYIIFVFTIENLFLKQKIYVIEIKNINFNLTYYVPLHVIDIIDFLT